VALAVGKTIFRAARYAHELFGFGNLENQTRSGRPLTTTSFQHSHLDSARQDEAEHLLYVLIACSTSENSLIVYRRPCQWQPEAY
jgi:hypothetical protein